MLDTPELITELCPSHTSLPISRGLYSLGRSVKPRLGLKKNPCIPLNSVGWSSVAANADRAMEE